MTKRIDEMTVREKLDEILLWTRRNPVVFYPSYPQAGYPVPVIYPQSPWPSPVYPSYPAWQPDFYRVTCGDITGSAGGGSIPSSHHPAAQVSHGAPGNITIS